ncbi:MAG: hypothetical protein J6M18_01515 [Actinomycetaceae bacterium]|nr:hypothetical protein [Actinomycetaceae bacterium]
MIAGVSLVGLAQVILTLATTGVVCVAFLLSLLQPAINYTWAHLSKTTWLVILGFSLAIVSSSFFSYFVVSFSSAVLIVFTVAAVALLAYIMVAVFRLHVVLVAIISVVILSVAVLLMDVFFFMMMGLLEFMAFAVALYFLFAEFPLLKNGDDSFGGMRDERTGGW